ncbi:hypothetical protein [Candidatus Berkiella aquae]|uniref:Uncharacterized protein n=1 Tax=Candidatus Berkiella aquae TaxID=295108 RepID=A0A0Q9YR85_9GAMM|nr:hypothetical protein [Candidatus Berkiella aquae]MCS5711637.1 hypothetical protein [Candidatus Berkiella aquae]
MFNFLTFLGLGGNAANLAGDALNVVKNANDATNSKLDKKKRVKARQNFIENMVNVGAPLAAGAVTGAVASPAGAIPAAQMTQSLVKSTGIGKLLGKIFHPVLAPFANLLGFFKRKIKDTIGLDIGKWLNFGVKVAQPVIGAGKVLNGGGNNALSHLGNNPLTDISSVFASRTITHSAKRTIPPLGSARIKIDTKPKPSYQATNKVKYRF